MSLFTILALLIVIAALFSYLNHRFLHLPTTIGVMLIALFLSLGCIVVDALGWHLQDWAALMLVRLNFTDLLLDVMLAFLLFAGSLHIDFDDLFAQQYVIGILATAGVVVSTLLVGVAVWILLQVLGHPLGLVYCLLFGAVISPTDPIAVLGILKSAGAPRSLETQIAGESLFNDGIGVVLFTVLLDFARGQSGHATDHPLSWLGIASFLTIEVIGALLLGIVMGYVTYRLLRTVDNYQVEVLITLALAMGLYALAQVLHSSGPLAVVVAGLFIGNTGRAFGMSALVRQHVDTFWELVDEILNVLLFVIIGLEVLVMTFTWGYLVAGLAAIPLVLLGRFLAVGGVVTLLKRQHEFTPHAIKVMTWGGLRGGISIALALSLPPAWGAVREAILTMAYTVVVFSIIVQGLTMPWLVRRIPVAAG